MQTTENVEEPSSVVVEPSTKKVRLRVKEYVPPARQFITRRWVVYSVVIACLAVAITLVVMSGILFSQNQNLIIDQQQPSTPPVVSQLQAPAKGLPQGFFMMSPEFLYSVFFGGDLQLFPTTTLGGQVLWYSGSSTLPLTSMTKDLYQKNMFELNYEVGKSGI